MTRPATPLAVRRFGTGDAAAWDAFVATSATGTFLHTRRFLSYHGDRFIDRSLCFFDGEGALRGLLPAASDPSEPTVIASHPGATYGGLLFTMHAAERLVPEMLAVARRHFAESGASRLRYKSVPVPLHSSPCQLDLFALWAAGARLHRRELWSVVDLVDGPDPAADRLRRRRRSMDAGHAIAVETSPEAYAQFHAMLVETLENRHGTEPTHSLAQMLELQQRFPRQIALWLARDEGGTCIAGGWVFDLGQARHLQYSAAREAGRASAQDGLLAAIMDEARARGARRFSFGTSVEPAQAVLNEGLFRFKAAFGAGCYVQDAYELDLEP